MTPIRTFTTILFISSATAMAQTPNAPIGVQVTPPSPAFQAPSLVSNRFNTDFPNINADWRKEGDLFRAEFLPAGSKDKHVVVYDQYAQLVYEDKWVEDAKVPEPLRAYHSQKFPSEKLNIRSRQFKDQDQLYYFVQKNDTLLFDKTGRQIPAGMLRGRPAHE